RFKLPAMTRRDANADPLFDMFDFTNPAQKTPPALPPVEQIDQATLDACAAKFPNHPVAFGVGGAGSPTAGGIRPRTCVVNEGTAKRGRSGRAVSAGILGLFVAQWIRSFLGIRTRKGVHGAAQAGRVLVGSRPFSVAPVPPTPPRSAVHKESAERVDPAV